MGHFLVFWGRHWQTGERPKSVGTGNREGGLYPGDEIFVLLSGTAAESTIIGHGYASSEIYRAPHFKTVGRTANWVRVSWETWLKPPYGLSIDAAAEAAPSFYWRYPQGGGIRIDEGASLRRAWERHVRSLPTEAFVTESEERPATGLSPASPVEAVEPTVRVDFHEPVWGPDLRSDDLLRADRHYLEADSVSQTSQDSLFLKASGEVIFWWTTSKIRDIEWLRPSPSPSSPTFASEVPERSEMPRPVADAADEPGTSQANDRSPSTFSLTDEQRALREKFLKMAGGGASSPNWDAELYRSLMEQAGIPRATRPAEDQQPSQSQPSPKETPSETTSTARRASANWTEQEDAALIKSAADGMSLEEVAQVHQRSENAIRVRYKKLGILAPDATIVRLFNDGWTIEELANHCREEPRAIRAQLIRSGINPERFAPTEVRRSESNEASESPPDNNLASPQTERANQRPSQTKLKEEFERWRSDLAQRHNVRSSSILSNAGIDEIVDVLPRSRRELLRVRNIQPEQWRRHWREILQLIDDAFALANTGPVSVDSDTGEDQQLSVESTDNLPEAVRRQFNISVSAYGRFERPGWFYVGTTVADCPSCGEPFEGFRRPYTAGGKIWHYWALVCLRCNSMREPAELDPKARRDLYASSELRPGLNETKTAADTSQQPASRPVIDLKKKAQQTRRRPGTKKPMENTDPYLSASGSGMVRNWGNRKARPAVTSDERAMCKACDRPAMNCVC